MANPEGPEGGASLSPGELDSPTTAGGPGGGATQAEGDGGLPRRVKFDIGLIGFIITLAAFALALVCSIAAVTYFYGRLEERVDQLEELEERLNTCLDRHVRLEESNKRLDALICERDNKTYDFVSLECKPVPLKVLNSREP